MIKRGLTLSTRVGLSIGTVCKGKTGAGRTFGIGQKAFTVTVCLYMVCNVVSFAPPLAEALAKRTSDRSGKDGELTLCVGD